ncbi:hypothetical protein HPB52_002191 [Rhipicephalus sanguineus]|uniref:Uncharacterized protein n=1 Tax=Rhipicephalus sanguineus TaxID=34632 RepID=A0A9D4SP82_RHISA|nr:hypothetical protein HPB52_002191 [Rhipicephalus sanguineus]
MAKQKAPHTQCQQEYHGAEGFEDKLLSLDCSQTTWRLRPSQPTPTKPAVDKLTATLKEDLVIDKHKLAKAGETISPKVFFDVVPGTI